MATEEVAEVKQEVVQEVTQEDTEKKIDGTKERRKRDDKPPTKADKPDSEAFEAAKAELDEVINGLKEQLDTISDAIKAKQVAQQKTIADRDRQRELAAEAKKKRDSFAQAEDQYRDEMDSVEKTRASQRTYLDNLKKGLKFTKVEDLDKATSKIIQVLSAGGLNLDTESKLAKNLQELRAQRDQVTRYNEQLHAIQSGVAGTAGIRELHSLKTRDVKAARAEEEAARKGAQEHSRKERALSKEIDTLYKSKSKLTVEKRAVNDKLRKVTQKFKKQEWAYDRWTNYESFLKRKAAREERAERIKREREQPQEEEEEEETAPGEAPVKKAPVNPHAKEIATLEELINYCTNLLPKQFKKEQDVDTDSKALEIANSRNAQFGGKGKVAVKVSRKDQDIDDSYVTQAPKKEKKQRKAKKVKDPSKIVINHVHDIFAKFHAVQIKTPLNEGQLAPTMEKLNAKKAKLDAWEPPKPADPSDEPSADHLAKEQKHRDASRRMSVQHLDAEQTRRVEEMEQHKADAAAESHSHRRASVQMAQNLAEEELRRRMVEQHDHEAAHHSHRRASVQMAQTLAEEEQRRRIQEHEAREPCERAENQRRASVAMDEEQARRIADHKNELERAKGERKASIDKVTQMVEEERTRRMSATSAKMDELSAKIVKAEAERIARGGVFVASTVTAL